MTTPFRPQTLTPLPPLNGLSEFQTLMLGIHRFCIYTENLFLMAVLNTCQLSLHSESVCCHERTKRDFTVLLLRYQCCFYRINLRKVLPELPPIMKTNIARAGIRCKS